MVLDDEEEKQAAHSGGRTGATGGGAPPGKGAARASGGSLGERGGGGGRVARSLKRLGLEEAAEEAEERVGRLQTGSVTRSRTAKARHHALAPSSSRPSGADAGKREGGGPGK